MEIREMRQKLGCTQIDFAKRYHIPFRTIQNWELGNRKPPEYIIDLLERQIDEDLINRKTIICQNIIQEKKIFLKQVIIWTYSVGFRLSENA